MVNTSDWIEIIASGALWRFAIHGVVPQGALAMPA
jgi:hypothetical protein